MSPHASILERLQSLKGPDREVDFDIFEAAWRRGPDEGRYWERRRANKLPGDYGPAYTASLDAAVALVVRVLPGYWSFALRNAMNALPADDPTLLPVYVLIEAFKALSPSLEEKP